MKNLKLFFSAILLLMTTVAGAAGFTRNGNTVTIQVANPQNDGARVVCLEVVNDNIIRVRATSEQVLPEKKSLIIVPQKAKPQFEVTEDSQSIRVKAANVSATVDKRSGDVSFYDAQGKQLLKEAKNGKTFKHFRVPKNKAPSNI